MSTNGDRVLAQKLPHIGRLDRYTTSPFFEHEGDTSGRLSQKGAIVNLIFLVLSAFVGAGLSIVGTWPSLGAISVIMAPIGGAVACVASAALLFALRRSSSSSSHASSVTPTQSLKPKQQPAAGASNDDQIELKRSA